MRDKDISYVLRKIRKARKVWQKPLLFRLSIDHKPFHVLISCILSLRTRDPVTETASTSLFDLAENPETMIKLPLSTIENTIYPVAFYKEKSKTILNLCRELIEQFSGRVPKTLDGLLKLKGVGRKTANMTMILGYAKPGICVDTHVHRITNRWGYLKTRDPDETETILRKKLPKRYWMEINDLLVTFGQNCCKPLSPHCTECCVASCCSQIGVVRNR